MKTLIIATLIGALIICAGVGVWYFKTKFYVPDKGGMERNLTEYVAENSKEVNDIDNID